MRRVNAGKLTDRAVKTLRASGSLDHWQKGRERIEAEDLMMFALGVEEDPDPSEEIPGKVRRRFEAMVERRATGEPIPFIKGYTEFRGLDLLVRPGVFVPRDASEFLAEQALRRLRGRADPVHVDLATGAGTIALAVANELPRASVIGTDVSAEAVGLARANARHLGLRARFVTGDLFGGLPRKLAGTVDVVTLHPPYVPMPELKDLPEEIRAWEPEHTLTDRSHDGLGLIGRTAREGPAWLSPNGWLLLEVSSDRVLDVKRVLRGERFRDIRSTKGGPLPLTRVIVARRPA